jgi:protein-disulfide isomerase
MSALTIPVSDQDHAQGPADAPCTLVEYGDFQCPHCRAAEQAIRRLQRHFGDRLRFVFRNFPLTRIHPYAQSAAETAEFAASHDRFWEMHHLIFKNQDRLDVDLFIELAAELNLDTAELTHALDKGIFAGRVRSDFTGGVRSGVNGTPTFFVNGERHNGSFEFDRLVEAVEEALRS